MSNMKPKIRVMVVDDSAFFCKLLSDLLNSHPDIEVVDVAKDAHDAREKIKRHNPDVITLDVEMPKMSGLDFLEKIMRLRPMPVVMVSTLTSKGAAVTLRALELGAVDFVEKPILGEKGKFGVFREELVYKVHVASQARVKSLKKSTSSFSAGQPKALAMTNKMKNKSHLMVIGSSTGGVEALYSILPLFPQDSPPILVVQHMPPAFILSLVTHLNERCVMEVVMATQDEPLQKGKIYIGPGDHHLEVRKKNGLLACHLQEGEKVSGHIPSVDCLFTSAAQAGGKEVVAAILTGMGRDGAKGMLAIREAGGRTFGQSAATCVVYGMPKAAFDLHGVEKEAPLLELPLHMLEACGWEKSFPPYEKKELP